MNFILLILFTLFNTILCQDEMRPEEFGFYFIHNPEKFSPETKLILTNVVKEYNSFYRYTNITTACESIIMDTPCDYLPSNDPDSLGFFVSILLLTIVNLGLLFFGLWKANEMMKTKLNPFRLRVEPLTDTTTC